MSILEEDDNYRVELNGDVAVCKVWSRPDLDSETGARLAAKKVVICRSLAAGQALGLIFDLREAPKVTGPKTQKSLELIMGAWEAAARPIAIIVSPASMQKLQLTRIARDAAPRYAEVFLDVDLARQWLERRLSGAQPAASANRHSSVRPSPGKRRS